MIIASQNLSLYNISIPENAVYRINLAWCDNIETFEKILDNHKENSIFVDLPIKRIKPPNNKYTLDDIIPVLKNHKQVKYFAISNVESSSDLQQYIDLLPSNVTIVPKIESMRAISNLSSIVSVLNNSKILMLDHDDLFSDILKHNELISKFKECITTLVEFCNNNDVTLLRTIGVIFSDEEKRISQYIK